MISSKFSTHRVSIKQNTCGNFQKFSAPQKWRPFWIFEFLPKMEKCKFAFSSLTVRGRAISSKFSTHRVSKKCTIGNFQKVFLSPKNSGHFEFLPKMEKHKFGSISLTVRDRAILSKFSINRVSQQSTLANFVQVLEQNSCFCFGGHYTCQCVLFLVKKILCL